MALGWSARRQILYYAVGGVLLALFLGIAWFSFFTAAPTCFDGKQNQDERGVDCGGVCSLICFNEAKMPTPLWNARTFETAKSNYTTAIYVRNQDPTSGASGAHYRFQLYDDRNILITEREGTIDLPPIPTIPIVEHNINVGNRVVDHAQFTFIEPLPAWHKIDLAKLPVLRKEQNPLSPDGRSLEVTIFNDSVVDARDVGVVAVLFDREGVARAASKTTLDRIVRKSSQNVVFTWPRSNSNIVRAEVTILPPF